MGSRFNASEIIEKEFEVLVGVARIQHNDIQRIFIASLEEIQNRPLNCHRNRLIWRNRKILIFSRSALEIGLVRFFRKIGAQIETKSVVFRICKHVFQKFSVELQRRITVIRAHLDVQAFCPLRREIQRHVRFHHVGEGKGEAFVAVLETELFADDLQRTDQLAAFRSAVDKRVAEGQDTMHAVLAEVRRLIRESEPIHFDGNGYTEEWKAEAAVRGLDTETNPALIFDAYLRADSVEMFTRTGVLTPRELQARNEVKWEMYTKKIQIEARVLGDLAINHIIPVATRYLGILLDNMDKARRIFGETKGAAMTASDAESAESIMRHTSEIRNLTDAMVEARKVANRITEEREKALAYSRTVAPKLNEIRRHIDKLELTVDNQLWPLPKYRELLFTR
mgnify:CR=1 FL=1